MSDIVTIFVDGEAVEVPARSLLGHVRAKHPGFPHIQHGRSPLDRGGLLQFLAS